MTKAGGNKALTLSLQEQKDYEKIVDNESGFPWTLVQDRDEIEKYWPSAVLPDADPPIATLINPEFQISEPSWAGFTFDGTLFVFNALLF